MSALAATVLVFVSFTVVALRAERRTALYLGGAASSAMLVILGATIFSFIFPSLSALAASLGFWLGLLAFVGYVIYDTHKILANAESGREDPLADAVDLFVDFVAIFVRLLRLFLDRSDRESKREERADSVLSNKRR